jgi:hypothetical protein
MTLEVYSPERFDALALRLLDIACDVREIADLVRENNLTTLPVHDKKANEFLSKLEDWTSDVIGRCQAATLKQRATRRAFEMEDTDDEKGRRAKKAGAAR